MNSKLYQFLRKYFFSPQGFILCLAAISFYITAPDSVQTGDTGELVTNSYFLRVSHPPGYPLWTLLYHLPVRYLGFGNPFHTASLVTVLLSLIWIGLLLFRFKNLQSLCMISVLVSSTLFWRYSIMPDVFGLHLLFLTLVFIAFVDSSLLKRNWIIFLISLSVANHHTITFVFPMYVYAALSGDRFKNFKYSLLCGVCSGSLYFLLFLFHPEEYGSWGNIDTWQNLLNHFLRSEYGTFNLQSTSGGGNIAWPVLFIECLISDAWSLVLVLAYIGIFHSKVIKSYFKQLLVLAFCLVSYLLTFLFSGLLTLSNYEITLFERFLLQPVFLIFMAGLLLLQSERIKLPRWLLMALLVNVGLNVIDSYRVNNFSKNTTLEDYVLNSLKSLPSNSIYHADGDAEGFASYYLHEVMNIRSDIIYLHPTLKFKWSAEKASQKFPEAFQLKENIFSGINLEKYSFLTNRLFPMVPVNTKVTFYGLLFKYDKSDEVRPDQTYACHVADKYEWKERPSLEEFGKFEFLMTYDLEYGRCYNYLAHSLLKQNRVEEAKLAFEKAVELSPFNFHFLSSLCHFYQQTNNFLMDDCRKRLMDLKMSIDEKYY